MFALKLVTTEIYTHLHVFLCSKKIQFKKSFTQFYLFEYPGSNEYEESYDLSFFAPFPLTFPHSQWHLYSIFKIYLKQSQQPWPFQSWFSNILRETKD